VGEGGDEVSVARFVADQRTLYRVPVAFTCALLGLSVSWFYKWVDHGPTKTQQRRAEVDAAVATEFTAQRGLHGSPRLVVDLRAKGSTVSAKTVADSMRRQGLVARIIKRRNGLTKQDKTAPTLPDLLRRDFTASAPNTRWVGDITEIPTAARGGVETIRGVVFHSDRGSTYTADTFTKACRDNGIRQSMGRVGSCFDNAAAEAFFSTLEWEVLSRHQFTDPDHAQRVVANGAGTSTTPTVVTARLR
jgi:transposase InsO family protein